MGWKETVINILGLVIILASASYIVLGAITWGRWLWVIGGAILLVLGFFMRKKTLKNAASGTGMVKVKKSMSISKWLLIIGFFLLLFGILLFVFSPVVSILKGIIGFIDSEIFGFGIYPLVIAVTGLLVLLWGKFFYKILAVILLFIGITAMFRNIAVLANIMDAVSSFLDTYTFGGFTERILAFVIGLILLLGKSAKELTNKGIGAAKAEAIKNQKKAERAARLTRWNSQRRSAPVSDQSSGEPYRLAN